MYVSTCGDSPPEQTVDLLKKAIRWLSTMQSSDVPPSYLPHSAARHYCQMQFLPRTFMSWQPERYPQRLRSSDQGMNGSRETTSLYHGDPHTVCPLTRYPYALRMANQWTSAS